MCSIISTESMASYEIGVAPNTRMQLTARRGRRPRPQLMLDVGRAWTSHYIVIIV